MIGVIIIESWCLLWLMIMSMSNWTVGFLSHEAGSWARFVDEVEMCSVVQVGQHITSLNPCNLCVFTLIWLPRLTLYNVYR